MRIRTKVWNGLASGVVLTLGLLSMTKTSQALPDYTKVTKKQCNYCHEGTPNSGKYTDAGQYYREHRSLKGFIPKQAPPQPPKQTTSQ